MRLFLFWSIVFFFVPRAEAQEHLDVRDLMTPQQIEAAGVDDLSPNQLDALNEWVKQFADQVWDLAIQATEEHYSKQSSPAMGSGDTPAVIESQIEGDFEGWEGETIFRLVNGQIWQQSSYAYTYHYAFMPNVLIYRKNGAYFMRVDGADGEIQVVRLR